MTDDDDPGEAPPRDRPFNAYRCPRSDKTGAIVADVMIQLQNYEKLLKLRQRKRRPDDQVTFEATVSAIVCDLIHHHLTKRDGLVAIPRSNQTLGRASRYRPVAYSKALPTILDRLASPEMQFVDMEVGYQNPFGLARQTMIKAGARLATRIEDHGVTLADLGKRAGEEIIILKRAKENRWDEGGQLDYDDTPKTRQHRTSLATINTWLASADIEFDHVAADCAAVDTSDRRLRRYFTNGSFESGGRLFGGFWQALKKRERFDCILIDGEDIVSLDYEQMAPRIMYGMVGSQPPDGDAYDLDDTWMPREGVKKIFNALLFAVKPIDRMPKGVRQMFPGSVKVSDVIGRVEARHADILHLFCTGVGHKGQFIESEILVDVLLGLQDQEIVGLPVHDAVIVPASLALEATRVMEKVFEDHTGVPGLVSEETA